MVWSFLIILFVVVPSLGGDYAEGRLIIKMKGQNSFQAMNQLRHQKLGSALDLQRSWQGLNMHEVKLHAGQDVVAMVQALEADPDIEFVEPDYYLYKQSLGVEPGSLSEFTLGGVSAQSLLKALPAPEVQRRRE